MITLKRAPQLPRRIVAPRLPKRTAGLRRALRAYHRARLIEAPPPARAPWRIWLLGCILFAALFMGVNALWPGQGAAQLTERVAGSLRVDVRQVAATDAVPAAQPVPEPTLPPPAAVPAKSAGRTRPEPQTILRPKPRSLAESRAEAMAEWQSTLAESGPTAAGKKVFNPALAARLDQIAAPVIRSTEAFALAPDAFGRQAVIIGDRCFQVEKLDDQALRGMAAWEPVSCQPGGQAPSIQLRKLRAD